MQAHDVVLDAGGGLLVGEARVLQLPLVGLKLGDRLHEPAFPVEDLELQGGVAEPEQGLPGDDHVARLGEDLFDLTALQRVEIDHVAGNDLRPQDDEVMEDAGADRVDRDIGDRGADRRPGAAGEHHRPRCERDDHTNRAERHQRSPRAPPWPRDLNVHAVGHLDIKDHAVRHVRETTLRQGVAADRPLATGVKLSESGHYERAPMPRPIGNGLVRRRLPRWAGPIDYWSWPSPC